MGDLKGFFEEVGARMDHATTSIVDGVRNAGELTTMLGQAANKRRLTTLLCGVSSFAAATLPMAADGIYNFGPNLVGAEQRSNLYGEYNQRFGAFLLKKAAEMGADQPKTDLEKADDAMACATGQIAGVIGGTTVNAIAISALTGGVGTGGAVVNGANTLTAAYRAVGLATQTVVTVNGTRETVKIGQELFSP